MKLTFAGVGISSLGGGLFAWDTCVPGRLDDDRSHDHFSGSDFGCRADG